MLKSGGGSMVNVSSTYGVVGPDHRIYEGMKFNSLPSYAAAKAGVHGLTRWLATYWGDKGTRNVLKRNQQLKWVDLDGVEN